MKKKIFSVITLICVFIVSIMPVFSSAKVYNSISGIYPISGLSGASDTIEVFGLFSYDNELYNIMTVFGTSVYFYKDGKTVSKNIKFDSIPADKSEFIIYYLCTPSSTISSYDNRLVTSLNGKKIGNVDSLPDISNKYNFVGKWILKDIIDLSSVPAKTYGFVNWYTYNTIISQNAYYSNLTIISSNDLGSYYRDHVNSYSFYYNNTWQYSWAKTINITDSYFITDESAEVFYNWLCNNAVSYNDGPVPDPTVPPDTQPPDTEPPDTEAPDTEAPDTEAPDTEAPDTEAPDTEAPDTETPVIPPADRFGFQEMMAGLSYSLFGNNGLAVQIWSWLVSPPVLPFFGIGIAIALLLLSILIVKRTF